MYSNRCKGMLLTVTLLLLIGLTGCGGDVTPSEVGTMDELQVRTVVHDMLTGYNQADYAAFSKDFSPALKLLIDETSFKDFCASSVDTLGQYRSIPELQQVSSDGKSSTWLITAKFTHSTEFFHITFNAKGQIDAMDFGPNQ